MNSPLDRILLTYFVSATFKAAVCGVGLQISSKPLERIVVGYWLAACTFPLMVVLFPALIPADMNVYVMASPFLLLVCSSLEAWILCLAFGSITAKDFLTLAYANFWIFCGCMLWPF